MIVSVDAVNKGLRRVPVWAVYMLCAFPLFWLVVLAVGDGLGRDPVKALEHKLGKTALQLLIVGLAITPIQRHLRVNLIRFRRAIGVSAFAYVLLHLLVWLFLDVQIWAQVWDDIVKRPYVTLGMVGFLALVPLAMTSNNWSVRRMGPVAWRRLHNLTYAAVLLGGLHYVWLVKGIQLTPIIYMAAILFLLALRVVVPMGSNRRVYAGNDSQRLG